jgi:hypothetical protein
MQHQSTAFRPPKKKRTKKILAIVAAVCLLGLGGWLAASKLNKKSGSDAKTAEAPKAQKSDISSLKGKYLFSGTVVLARAVERDARGDYNQPFSQMNTLGTFDSGMSFFECPVTDGNVPFSVQVASLKFNCEPGWLPALKKHFPIINLSSNHVYDMGADGFAETVKRTKEAGLQVIGNYNPHAEDDNCKVVILPVRLQKQGSEESAKLPIAFCSYNYKSLFKPEPGELEKIKEWSQYMPVFGILNSGPEYQHIAGPEQTEYAHKMIDYGAEFVIGNGTHWVQNTEVYKGKLIVYSMGNFIFDQIDYDGRIHMSIGVDMSVNYDGNVEKWLEIGAGCQINSNDACLKTAQSKNLSKIKPSYKFEAIGSYGGLREVAHKASADQQKDIENLANWQATLKELGQ